MPKFRIKEIRPETGEVIADFTHTEAEARKFHGDEEFDSLFGPPPHEVGRELAPNENFVDEHGGFFDQHYSIVEG